MVPNGAAAPAPSASDGGATKQLQHPLTSPTRGTPGAPGVTPFTPATGANSAPRGVGPHTPAPARRRAIRTAVDLRTLRLCTYFLPHWHDDGASTRSAVFGTQSVSHAVRHLPLHRVPWRNIALRVLHCEVPPPPRRRHRRRRMSTSRCGGLLTRRVRHRLCYSPPCICRCHPAKCCTVSTPHLSVCVWSTRLP